MRNAETLGVRVTSAVFHMGSGPASLQERLTLVLLAALVLAISVLPMLRLLAEAFAGGEPSRSFLAVWSQPAAKRALVNSLETSLAATALALLFGGLVAVIVTLSDMRARNAYVFLFVMPLIIAPQVMALAWLQISGPSSPLLAILGLAPPLGARNPLYSREGIVLLLTVEYAPLVFLTLRAGLRAIPRELIEAALAAGAGRFTVLRTIILPLAAPAAIAGAALVFVSCLGNFGIAAFLGIPAQYLTLPTLIYQRLAGFGPGALPEVAVLSLGIGLLAGAGILAQEWLQRRRDVRVTATLQPIRPFALGRWRLPVEVALWSVTLLLVVLPLSGLIATALTPAFGVPLGPNTATLANFKYVIAEHAASRRAFANSLFLSAAAALLIVLASLLLGYFIAVRRSRLVRVIGIAAEWPYALPGVVLSIACILLFLKPLPLLGLTLYNTIWILLVAYIARFLVLGLRPIVGGYLQLDRSLEEAAQAGGAGFFRRLVTIILPVIAPSAAAGGILVFLTAFNELTVSALLWSSGAETLGVAVFSLEQGGESAAAAALAALATAVTVLLALATLLFRHRLPAGALPWRD
jgi:iron(III) transport system permease protein